MVLHQFEGRVQPVKGRVPNAWGLYDMHGNVCEFCQDFYDFDYYKTSLRHDPQGPSDGAGHVSRGAAAHLNEGGCRSARRGPGKQEANTGFRVVQVIAPPDSEQSKSPAKEPGVEAPTDDPDRSAAE